MLKFVVQLSWNTKQAEDAGRDYREGDLWKIVEMPSLPPIGTRLWFSNDPGDCADPVEVAAVEWWEDRPRWFEVTTNMVIVDEDADAFRERMKKAGWRDEAIEPFYEST